MRAIGFTGTRHGMTEPQSDEVRRLLQRAHARGIRDFAFGLCVGADEEAAIIARGLNMRLHGFPAYEAGNPLRSLLVVDVLADPTPPLERNAVIVASSRELVAAPSGGTEVRRSGTWWTIRAARERGLPVSVVLPSGALLD